MSWGVLPPIGTKSTEQWKQIEELRRRKTENESLRDEIATLKSTLGACQGTLHMVEKELAAARARLSEVQS